MCMCTNSPVYTHTNTFTANWARFECSLRFICRNSASSQPATHLSIYPTTRLPIHSVRVYFYKFYKQNEKTTHTHTRTVYLFLLFYLFSQSNGFCSLKSIFLPTRVDLFDFARWPIALFLLSILWLLLRPNALFRFSFFCSFKIPFFHFSTFLC